MKDAVITGNERREEVEQVVCVGKDLMTIDLLCMSDVKSVFCGSTVINRSVCGSGSEGVDSTIFLN